MSDLIDRQDAIVALRNVWNALWEIDIPSPSVPEYIEHHEQVQGIMRMVQDMIDTLPCTESQRESAQVSGQGDMISRKMLLEDIDSWVAMDSLERKYQESFREVVASFPSAEPDAPDTNVGDTIRRQAAIDALNKLDVSDGVGISSVACDLQEEAIRSIENLPSAQSEIVRCKECKEFRRWIDTDITFCDRTEYEVKEDDFCSKAERRTDDQRRRHKK